MPPVNPTMRTLSFGQSKSPANSPYPVFKRASLSDKTIYFPDQTFQDEHVLELNALEKANLHLTNTFIETPRSVAKGLRGDPDFGFGDFLRIGKIPYYLGGAFLTLLFVAGGSKVTALRQGVGVLLYYLGVIAGNRIVDEVVQAKYGVNLNLKYKKHTGKTENVFTSPVFSRYDLIPKKTIETMRKKMGIPAFIADPEGEVRQVIQDLIPAARTAKILFSTTLAAFGAGYLARTDAWTRLFGGFKPLKGILFDSQAGSLGTRMTNGITLLSQTFKDVFNEKFRGRGSFAQTPAWFRRSAIALPIAAGAYSLWQIFRIAPSKDYARPGTTLSDRLQNSNNTSVFRQFMIAQNPRFPSDHRGGPA